MSPRDQPPGAEMPFLEHLEELRQRLFWVVAALAIGFFISFTFCSQFDVIAVLAWPAQETLHGAKLVYTGPADTFSILLKVSVTLGLVLASPVIAYQVWAFLSPALHEHERRVAVPVLIGAVGLFLVGVTLAVLWVLPVTLQLLAGISSSALQPMITATEYFSFAVALCLAFGVVFELPILILGLTALGLVSPALMSRYRRHAFVGLLVVAMVVTPGDVIISTLMLFVPLYALYEFSIVLSWLVFRDRLRREAGEGTAPGTAAA